MLLINIKMQNLNREQIKLVSGGVPETLSSQPKPVLSGPKLPKPDLELHAAFDVLSLGSI